MSVRAVASGVFGRLVHTLVSLRCVAGTRDANSLNPRDGSGATVEAEDGGQGS